MPNQRGSCRNKKKKTSQRGSSSGTSASGAVASEPPSDDATVGPSQALHKLLKFKFKGKLRCMICDGPATPSALTALYNYFLCHVDPPKEVYSHQSEEDIKRFLKHHLSFKMNDLKKTSSISEDELKLEIGLKEVIQSLAPDNLLCPVLKSIADFKVNDVNKIFKYLGVPLLHGWMLNPEDEFYESLKSYSHEDLQMYANALNDDLSNDAAEKRDFIQSLLDVRDNHTSIGYAYLVDLLKDGVLAVLYWKTKFNLIYYENESLLLLETDPDVVSRYPNARWRVFEEVQAENIYLDDEFCPAEKHPNVAKARSWYNNMLSKKFGGEPKKLSKRQRRRERELQKKAVEKMQEDSSVVLANQGGNRQAAEGDVLIPFNAPADSTAPEGSIAQADYPTSEADQRENYHEAADENVVQDSPASEGTNMAQAGSLASERGQVGDDQGQTSPKDQPESSVANQFFQFLRMFRDDDKVLYFEGVVAAIKHTGSPKFRVPYDFIKTHNKELAMKICESYPRYAR